MKSIVKVELLYEIEYQCEEHKQMLLKGLRARDSLYGCFGFRATRNGECYDYSVRPLARGAKASVVLKQKAKP